MKSCYGDYTYKGFSIRWSDYDQAWRLEPYYLDQRDGDTDIVINFEIEYHNSYSPRFRTINSAKQYIRSHEQELKEEIEKLYQEYIKENEKYYK